MNSKLFSRIAALVLCVVMLGTVSFAAEATLDAANNQFTISDDADYIAANEQMTMMAYTVDDTVTADSIPVYSDQKIVALDQISEGSFGTVKFNRNKIAADKKLAVVLGGTSGDVLKMLLATEDIHLVKNVTTGVETLATANALDLTIDEVTKTYKDVKVFGCRYTPTENTVIKKVRFNLKSKKDGAEAVEVAKDLTALEGESEFIFKVALIGLPDEYLGKADTNYEITAVPSFDYEGNVKAAE